MARFVQLLELISDVRLDLGDDPDTARGRYTDKMIKRTLNRVQNFLWESYEWPYRFREWAVPLVAETRFYSLPHDVNVNGIQSFKVKWGSAYLPVDYGYSNDLWSEYDPHNKEYIDPIQRWRLHEPVNGETKVMIEVWPTPATSGKVYESKDYTLTEPAREVENDAIPIVGDNYILLRAARICPEMLRNADRCFIDSEVLIAYTVAEIAARRGLPDSQMKMQYAQKLLSNIKGTSSPMTQVSLVRRRAGRFNSSNQWHNRYAPRQEKP